MPRKMSKGFKTATIEVTVPVITCGVCWDSHGCSLVEGHEFVAGDHTHVCASRREVDGTLVDIDSIFVGEVPTTPFEAALGERMDSWGDGESDVFETEGFRVYWNITPRLKM